jgi:1,4-alpha-glucan branching enzyme
MVKNKLIILGIFLMSLINLTINSNAYAKTRLLTPLRTDWTQSFFTDDSSLYLTLFPDGFKQLIRVDHLSCNQITNLSIILKDSKLNLTSDSQFRSLNSTQAPNFYGINNSNYCWYEVEIHGLNLQDSKSIKYILKIEDNIQSTPFYFKGITNSLLPTNRLTSDQNNIDAWIDLGGFGATPVAGGGVFYKTWEPLSEQVDLFINNDPALKMNAVYNLNDERRFHFLYVPTSNIKDKYHFQFVKNGRYESLEVANFKTISPIKIDPWARGLSYESKGGRYNGFINPRGIVLKDNDPNEYVWRNDKVLSTKSALDYNNWIIYQLWPLTFNPKEVGGAYVQGKFSDINEKIPYLKDLGVSAVEFLPVHESRFNASWGYALDSLIIIESTLGPKKDLKKLIDDFHGNDLKIIFDVVLNHVNNNLLREPLSAIENSSKFYSGDTAWGPKPRFESIWVRKWMADSLVHLINEYHLDGFRFDMTDSIFNGTKGGFRFLQELNLLLKIHHPGFYSSAEQLPDDVWVTYPISDNGLGFDAQWNDRFKNFFELEFDQYSNKNRNVDMKFLADAMKGMSDHEMSPDIYYNFGDPKRTVNYLGSHDFVGNKNPFLRIITQYEGYETEDNNTFTRVNPLQENGDLSIPFRKIHNSFSHSAARAAYGILFTKPGAALFYQGEEIAQDLNLENEWAYVNATDGNRFPSKNVNIDKYVRSHRMPWYYFDLTNGQKIQELSFVTKNEQQLFKGHLDFFKEMIKFKKNNPEINLQDAVNVNLDNNAKILTYEIKTSTSWYFVVANFGGDSGGSWVSFPGDKSLWWKEFINSSETKYAGDNGVYSNVISNIGGRSNLLRLKGPGFYLFQAFTGPSLKKNLYFRSTLNAWKANPTQMLKFNPSNPEELVTLVQVNNDSTFEFKLGSDDWEIDLGKYVQDLRRPKMVSTLSYIPLSQNVKQTLSKGTYQFKFNINSFTYSFEKTSN